MNAHGAKSRGHRVTLCAPRSALCDPRPTAGFAYIALLVAIIIIGISLTTASKYWNNVTLRDKEEELLFRGDQYRQAIEHYYLYLGRRQYPPSIDDLVKDSRSAVGMHHLRQKFKDPITGDDFVEIKDPAQRIVGVHSSSDKLSIKQGNFPDTMLISSVPSVTSSTQLPVQTGGTNTMQASDQTDGSDIASTNTPTIKHSDWLFVSTIKAAPPTTTPAHPIVPGQTPVPGQRLSQVNPLSRVNLLSQVKRLSQVDRLPRINCKPHELSPARTTRSAQPQVRYKSPFIEYHA